MAVSTYGVWGGEARELFNSVIMHIMNQVGLSKSVATSFVYNWLGIVIARENAQAILAKLPIQKVGRSDIVNLVGRDAESPFLVPENIFPVVVRPPVDVVPPVCVVSPAVSPSVPSLRAVPPPPSPPSERPPGPYLTPAAAPHKRRPPPPPFIERGFNARLLKLSIGLGDV